MKQFKSTLSEDDLQDRIHELNERIAHLCVENADLKRRLFITDMLGTLFLLILISLATIGLVKLACSWS